MTDQLREAPLEKGDTTWPAWYCPFMDEPRDPKDLSPCPSRYRHTCGCKKRLIPTPFRKYRRSSA